LILDHIRTLAARGEATGCDAELLRQFVCHHEEEAFEALLHRHGPMVLRVARRVLDNETDAEDVFQATFLLLARRAAAIRKRESVAGWLHSVAHRLALSARGQRARRKERESRAAQTRSIEAPPGSAWSELEETLHEVLAQLPAKYRTPLIYCYLEGWTQEEVARHIGKPLGTVRSWLARGRELLRKRLLRRGISLSIEGAGAALLASACAPAEAVPPALRMATLQAAHLFAAGENAMTLLSPAVAALVRKGLTTMLLAKLKSGAVCLLIAAFLVAGTGWAAQRTFGAKIPEQKETEEKTPPKPAITENRPPADALGDPLPPGAVARLGTSRFRHEETHFWQFGVSPDGHTLATAAGRSLILWDMATGRARRRFPLDQTIRCLAFAPDGKSVTVGGEDCIVHRLDLASGKELQRYAGHQGANDPLVFFKGISGVAFTSEGRKLISWGSDNTVRVWEAHSGKELHQLDGKEFGSKNWHISGFSPDGKLLAVSIWIDNGQQSILNLWNLETGKEVRQRAYPNNGAAFSPDGKILAIAEANPNQSSRIVLVDVESGKELAASPSKKGSMYALVFAPDGKTLASGESGQSKSGPCIRLWEVRSMKEIRATSPLSGPYNSVSQLAFSPDGKTLISRSSENHVRLWDVASGNERIFAQGPSQLIRCLAFSPNAKLVASASANRIWLWSATTGKLWRILESPEHYVVAATFSPDGKVFISVSVDGTLQLWDPDSGKELRRIQTIKGRFVQHAALAPDGETIALWDSEVPQTIVLWNIRTGEKQRDLGVPSEEAGVRQTLYALQFSPDGKTLYACSGTDTRILRWDAASGKDLPSIGKHDGGVNGIALSSDGRSMAALSLSGALYLWETATGQARLVLKDVGFSTHVAFSPEGSLLALVNSGNHRLREGKKEIVRGVENREQVRLVRVADGKVIHRFTGHLGGINRVSFSPDGRTLASGGQDTTVLLWDVTKMLKNAAKETPSLSPEKIALLWQGLGGTAAEAHGCMGTLISAPAQSVPVFADKLKPVAAVDAERFARLLKKLESDQFAEREEATRELTKLGDAAEPALRKALEEKNPLETRRRLQALLDDLDGKERLRSLRAIEVLERIGDPPARDLLRRLAGGAAGAWLTNEARLSLQRLEQRGK
jgi:RNA polymerase sigma factor (sigma-70 family)